MIDQAMSETLSRQTGGPRLELIPSKKIVEQAADTLPRNVTLTITCSPAQGMDATIETTLALAPHFDRVIPHMSARMVRDAAHLDAMLEQLERHNLDEVFVVGGDQEEPLGPYRHGLDLLKALRAHEKGPRRIGIPAYPEGHPHVDDDVLIKDLTAKAPLADYGVTQMCFDPDQVLNWLRTQQASNVPLPFYLGIPGPVRPDKLLRIAPRIGVTDSLRFLRKNLKLSGKLLRGYDPNELLDAYKPYFDDPEYGIAGFHTYTFNELASFKHITGKSQK